MVIVCCLSKNEANAMLEKMNTVKGQILIKEGVTVTPMAPVNLSFTLSFLLQVMKRLEKPDH